MYIVIRATDEAHICINTQLKCLNNQLFPESLCTKIQIKTINTNQLPF